MSGQPTFPARQQKEIALTEVQLQKLLGLNRKERREAGCRISTAELERRLEFLRNLPRRRR